MRYTKSAQDQARKWEDSLNAELRLQFAAPYLLKAAKRLIKALSKGDPQYSMNEEEGLAANALKAAIKKATGGE